MKLSVCHWMRSKWMLLILVFVHRVQLDRIDYCHPAQEGKPYLLADESPSQLNLSLSDFIWSVRYANGTLLEVSHCHYTEYFCYDFTEEFTPSKRKVADIFINLFEIEMIKPEHRNMEIILESADPDSDKRSTLFSCRLPSYSEPVAPTCSAKKKSRNSIEVVCTAKGIYPDVMCEIFQVKGLNSTPAMITSNPEYRKNTKVKDIYKQVTCSTTVLVPHLASYRYYAEIIPQVPGLKGSIRVKSKESNPVIISETTVAVKMIGPGKQPIDVCPSQVQSVEAKCEAYGFTSRPVFTWKLNDQTVQHNGSNGPTVQERQSPNGLVFYQSHQVQSLQEVYNAQCLVSHESLGQKKKMEAKDTMKIRFRRLNHAFVKLSHVGGVIEDGAQVDLQKDDTLFCKMENQPEDAKGIEINCHRDGRLVIRRTSEGDRVRAFMTSVDPGTMECECKALLSGAQCRQHPQYANITLLGNQRQSRELSVSDKNIEMILLFTIIPSLLCVVVFIIVCRPSLRLKISSLRRPTRQTGKVDGERALVGKNYFESNM